VLQNKKYYAATQEAVKKIKSTGRQIHMLDIGTGSGLLAMMAITSGADTATACEVIALAVTIKT
jgi:protein arginine N-methyltransferase 7